MNEELIKKDIEKSLLYYRKCKNRCKLFKPLTIIFAILFIVALIYIIFFNVYIFKETFDLAKLGKYTEAKITEIIVQKYSVLIIIYDIIYPFLYVFLGGLIGFGTVNHLNKKAYLRHENKVYTLKKDLKRLEEEKSHS